MKGIGFLRAKKDRNEEDAPEACIKNIHVSRILPNPYQNRKNYDGESIIRLADSIRRYGMIQPIGVRRLNSGRFELIFGERRLRAAKLIDLESVPCIVFGDVSGRLSCEMSYVENALSEPLNYVEKAADIETLIRRFDMRGEAVCEHLSIYRSEASFLLKILRLTPEEREMICDSDLTAAHLEQLMKIDNGCVRRHLMKLMIENGVSSSGCADFISEFLRTGREPEPYKRRTDVKKPRAVRRFVLKDVRVFMNSLDHAIDLVEKAGVGVECEKQTGASCITYRIKIPCAEKTKNDQLFI